MMTPEDFDLAYFRLAQLLGMANDPDLIRDRLLLLLAQRMSLSDFLEVLDAAQLTDGEEGLKRPDSGAAVVDLAHR